ncbi:MAG: ribonuclease J [Bdellovibrionales bacterium]|nr:ribonuclease J [Bdellovibrionales bacterium]
MNKSLKIVPLGGLGEIGMNMMVLECGRDAIIIDCGVMFADANVPGVNLIIPNFEYLRKTKLNIHAVILTHGHEDHLGALPFLLHERPIPVYGSRFTTELLKFKLTEFGLLDSTKVKTVRDADRISAGPFDIEFIRMSHSISDAMGLAIRTPVGLVVHTGDFKIDPHPADGRKTDLERYRELGKEGILLLLSDSTNVEVPGKSMSESSVRDGIDDLMKATKGWFVLSSFASHIPRVQQVIELAMLNKRRVCVAGRTMVQNINLAKRLGYLEFPESLLIDFKQATRLPRHKVAIVSTGSQGETRSALAKMALSEHKELILEKGDSVVLSSRFIPGNEKSIYYIMNHLYRRGAEVFTNTGSDIHVSGHAYQEDLREMLLATKPQFFIPVHGEYRHLVKHVELAHECGVKKSHAVLLENGEPALVTKDKITKQGAVLDVTKIAIDGLEYLPINDNVIKNRRKLSDSGVLAIGLCFDGDSGELVGNPTFKSKGLCDDERMHEILPKLTRHILQTIDKATRNSRFSYDDVEEEVRITARRFLVRELDKKPIILPMATSM